MENKTYVIEDGEIKVLYAIYTNQKPLEVVAFPDEKAIKLYVEKFPKRLKTIYRKINLKEAKEIEEEINKNLATILLKNII